MHHPLGSGPYTQAWRWIGGASLLIAPLFVLLGVVLRLPVFFDLPPDQLASLQEHFTYFPLQFAVFEVQPALIAAAYGSALLGNILLLPALLTLAVLIGANRPGWALLGGIVALLGLLKRLFNAGVDHMAFALARVQGAETATLVVADTYVAISYGPLQLIGILGFAVLFGWILLAIGAYLSGTLDAVRSIALALTAFLYQGVLKGSPPISVLLALCLVLALTTLGIQLLRGSNSIGGRRLEGA